MQSDINQERYFDTLGELLNCRCLESMVSAAENKFIRKFSPKSKESFFESYDFWPQFPECDKNKAFAYKSRHDEVVAVGRCNFYVLALGGFLVQIGAHRFSVEDFERHSMNFVEKISNYEAEERQELVSCIEEFLSNNLGIRGSFEKPYFSTDYTNDVLRREVHETMKGLIDYFSVVPVLPNRPSSLLFEARTFFGFTTEQSEELYHQREELSRKKEELGIGIHEKLGEMKGFVDGFKLRYPKQFQYFFTGYEKVNELARSRRGSYDNFETEFDSGFKLDAYIEFMLDNDAILQSCLIN